MNDQKWLIFKKENFKLLFIAVGIIVLGLIIMAIGDNNYDNAFGFRRITLAPILLLVGYVLVIVSIMKVSNSSKEE